MSGMINALVTSVAFIWGAPWRQGQALRVLHSIQRVAIGIALGIVLLFYFYPDALLSRLAIYQETLMPNSPTSELGHRAWTYPMYNFLGAFDYDRWPYGYGIGTTALGGQYVARFFNVKPPVIGVESGFGTLVVEMGIFGPILWLLWASVLLWQGWKVVRKLRETVYFPLGFAIWWYVVIALVLFMHLTMALYQNFVNNAYLWLLLGVLFRLPKLAQMPQPIPIPKHVRALSRWQFASRGRARA